MNPDDRIAQLQDQNTLLNEQDAALTAERDALLALVRQVIPVPTTEEMAACVGKDNSHLVDEMAHSLLAKWGAAHGGQ